MEFVHHYIVIEIGGRLFGERLRIERLNGHKQVVYTLRAKTANKELAKISILQNGAEGHKALLEDLLAVSDEKQAARFTRVLLAESLIIQG